MRSSRPPLLALCVVLSSAAAIAPALARAQNGLALDWRAPDECPTAQTVQSMVAEFLGTDPGTARAIRADASVERDAQNRYWLLLRIDNSGQQTERSLSDPDCATLARASALLIAIAINPEVEARVAAQPLVAPPVTAPPVAAQPVVPPPASPPPPPPPVPAEPADKSEGALVLQPGAELRGVLDAGTLHGTGFGFGGAFTLRVGMLRLALGAQWFLPRSIALATPDSGNAHLNAATTVTRACVAWTVSRFDLGPCAVLELGLIWGDTRGIQDPSSGHALWLSFGGGVQARWHFMRGGSLFVDGALLAPHVRRRFYVNTDEGQVSVHQVPPATGRVGVGIAYEVE